MKQAVKNHSSPERNVPSGVDSRFRLSSMTTATLARMRASSIRSKVRPAGVSDSKTMTKSRRRQPLAGMP